MAESLTLSSQADWKVLQGRDLTSVVDPTIVRVADLFAQGGEAAEHGSWDIITGNLHALATFVDALVLEPGIPVFDYRYSLDDGSKGSPLVLEYCEGVAQPVRVEPNVWAPISTEVATTLAQASRVPANCDEAIGRNLRALKWKYIPFASPSDVTNTKTAGGFSDSQMVRSYLFVLLAFSRYAAELNGTQVLDDGQSRDLLLAALPHHARGGLGDAVLFEELNNLVNRMPHNAERPLTLERPSFLPYLAPQIRKPRELFQRAVELRDRADVRDYRQWIRDVQGELDRGELKQSRQEEIRRITESLDRSTNRIPLRFEIKLVPIPALAFSVSTEISSPLFWLFSIWPGKRYRRLLSRLSKAQLELVNAGAALEKAWRAA